MAITVKLDISGLQKFQIAAEQLSGGVLKRAMRESLTAAGMKTRTQVRRALKEQTNVKAAKDVNERTRSYLNSGALEYVIEGNSRALPIDRIGNLSVTTGPGGGVSAAPWDVLRQFQRSFVLHGHYVARLGHDRMPLRRLYGPSIAKEMVKDESLIAFTRYGLPELTKQLNARLERLLVGSA